MPPGQCPASPAVPARPDPGPSPPSGEQEWPHFLAAVRGLEGRGRRAACWSLSLVRVWSRVVGPLQTKKLGRAVLFGTQQDVGPCAPHAELSADAGCPPVWEWAEWLGQRGLGASLLLRAPCHTESPQ